MTKFKKRTRGTIKKEHIIAIIISLLITIISITNVININYNKKESKYIAQKGILDLTNWDYDKEKIVKLDGEWEFYSGKLIYPEEGFENEKKTYINVPETWENYLTDEALENGSGTYRLIIKVPNDKQYGIKAKTIRISNRIYLNGDRVAQVGNPSTNREEVRAGSKYNIGIGDSIDKEIELLVHVTSIEYRSGGIIKSIELGLADSIMVEENQNIAIDALVVSVCLVLGFYFFLLYLQRHKNLYLLYFSGANIFMGISLSTMNEQVLKYVCNYDYIERLQLQIFTMIMVTVCLLRFIYYFFKDYSSKKIANIITGVLVAMLLLALENPEKPMFIPLRITQIIVIISMAIAYIYIFYVLVKEISKKTDSLEYILVIATALYLYWLLIALKTFLELDLGDTNIILILIIMFGVASLTSRRLQLDYREAKKLSEKLIRYDKLKDDFLIRTSHELRMPLTVIGESTKNILEGEKGVLNLHQQEGLFRIYQETEILKRITEDLLDAALIKEGNIKLRLIPISPYEIIEDILKESEILIPNSKPIVIKNKIEKDFPKIYVDSDKFRQIIYSLIHNAIKYTKYGEITITALHLKEQAQIEVKDTGVGIDEKYLKEVFDVFFRKDIDENSKHGLGLGLSIAKHLIEIQGGKIYAKSKIGEGSSFVFTLPLYTGDEEQIETVAISNDDLLDETIKKLPKTLKTQNVNSQNQEKILIIEDELLNQKLLYNIIKELGYDIIISNSGRKALEIIKNNKIDLVVLDFMLSDMTSASLCRQIREEYSMGELPILILTSSRKTINLMGSFDYGVNDFQKKPVDPEELKSRIQSLLLIKSSAEEGLEKELQYFYSQISPHFLYNTLNSIIGLSYKDIDRTRQALNNLSVYLRGKLDIHRKKGFVTLESEIELVVAYLEIEELRYGDKLEVIYNIEEGLETQLPPLILQPIVENAVRHGIATRDSNGKIKISIERESEGFIDITIEDNGKGMNREEREKLLKGDSKGIGSKNVIERLKLLKGATLTLESDLNKGTKVKIIIPEVKNYESNSS